MITNLHLKNFKAWRDTGPCPMAPLTVLFGTNSAGKTSFAQMLLLLKQTAASPDRQRALHFGDSNTDVDLGTFQESVHGHDVALDIEVGLDWNLPSKLSIRDPLTQARCIGDRIRFDAVVATKSGQPTTRSLKYDLHLADHLALSASMTRQLSGGRYDLKTEGYKLQRRRGHGWKLPEPNRFYGFPDEINSYYLNAAFTADLSLEIEKLLRSVYYVGPLREYPKRLYLWSGEKPDHVGLKGERAVEAILAAGDRAFNFKANQRLMILSELVAQRLKSMGLINEFKIQPLAEGRKEHEVLVKTSLNSAWVKLTDVGFGVGQVLPVIVESFYVPPRSIVIYEQPEIHLHPKVQSELADLFIDAVNAREDGEPRNCQFIIESHSEHFLHRLQRRIAEGRIAAEDVALYFVSTVETTGEAYIEPLKVDTFGNILNWPENFFGDEMEDLVARSTAQAGRMQTGGE